MNLIRLQNKKQQIITKHNFYELVYKDDDFRDDLKYMFKLNKLKLKDFTFIIVNEIYSSNDDNEFIELIIIYKDSAKKYYFHIDLR